jgi:hypothetical protein
MNTTTTISIDNRFVDLSSLEVDGIRTDDAPEFCEAHWSYGEFEDGSVLTEGELEKLGDLFPVPYETIINYLY